MKPGDTPKRPYHHNNRECMRLCFSCVTGISPSRIRFIDPHADTTFAEWWSEWEEEAKRHGYELQLYSYPWVEMGIYDEPEGLWIAGVKSFGGTDHALVMNGPKLHYDPAEERKQRPHKFIDVTKVVPLD